MSFESSGYGPESQCITFLLRPEVGADQVILPPRSLERIVAHVSGMPSTGRHLPGREPGPARALQPAIVLLEDCDLVAEDRG